MESKKQRTYNQICAREERQSRRKKPEIKWDFISLMRLKKNGNSKWEDMRKDKAGKGAGQRGRMGQQRSEIKQWLLQTTSKE